MAIDVHPDSELVLYTDGGASPNPGPAGWGVVMLDPKRGSTRELSGGDSHSTNNRMELTAAICGLEETEPGSRVEVVTDSTYLRQGITRWVAGWRRNRWKRKDGKRWVEVKNRDLWQRLVELDDERRVRWHWIKGHAGHEHNERADELATAEIERLREETPPAPGATPSEVEGTALWLRVSCNRGRGVWVALVQSEDEQHGLDGLATGTTANRLELEALLAGLAAIEEDEPVTIFTTSDYLKNGASQWLDGWQRRSWKSADGSPVKNRELWQQVAREKQRRELRFERTPKGAGEHEELGKRLRERAKPG